MIYLNIILLSGGCGKRLWPLSNDVRSKQFLKLLKHGEKSESMIERVFRQISCSFSDPRIVIATGKAQAELVKCRLGSRTDTHIVCEPDRRNTYPAIALSCAFLIDRLGASPDEPVIVLPADQFAGSDYFTALGKMYSASADGIADLILMGIEPSEPSSKFGYILSEKGVGSFSNVIGFREKPDELSAYRLISEGAKVNGGVFAFKLGWLLERVYESCGFSSFDNLYNNYSTLNPVSFDCEIAENCKSAAMLYFNGKWKDLGTWNSLSEEIPTSSGNVISSDDNLNSTFINELDIPIIALGTSNLIIAASSDGILVADKSKSQQLKSYADLCPSELRFQESCWGTRKTIESYSSADGLNPVCYSVCVFSGCTADSLSCDSGSKLYVFTKGSGQLITDSGTRSVLQGDFISVEAKTRHSITAFSELKFIEIDF